MFSLSIAPLSRRITRALPAAALALIGPAFAPGAAAATTADEAAVLQQVESALRAYKRGRISFEEYRRRADAALDAARERGATEQHLAHEVLTTRHAELSALHEAWLAPLQAYADGARGGSSPAELAEGLRLLQDASRKMALAAAEYAVSLDAVRQELNARGLSCQSVGTLTGGGSGRSAAGRCASDIPVLLLQF